MDIYGFLNLKLIDPQNGEGFFWWLYLGFNYAEALLWFVVAVIVALRFRLDAAGMLQILALVAFGVSDLIECQGTTPLLLLFKGALIIALLQGRKRLFRRAQAQN